MTVLLSVAACSDAKDADEPATPLAPALLDELVCVRDDGERSVQDLTGGGGEMADEDAAPDPPYVGSSPRAALRALEGRHELFAVRPGLLDTEPTLNEGVRQAEALYVEDGNAAVFVALERLPDGARWQAGSMVVCADTEAFT